MLPTDYQTYYVYFHFDPRDNTIVYVGMGQGSRAWAMGSYRQVNPKAKQYGRRDKEHAEWLDLLYLEGYLPDEWVKIISKGLTKQEAAELEREFIEDHRPKFNKQHNPDHNFSRVPDDVSAFAKALRGLKYSYTQIAYLLGGESLVSRENKKAMSIWRMINGK